ncbi:hypothetical protein HYDPIDRAFT_102394, partial [Hydnomerulius pinastri MD-312]
LPEPPLPLPPPDAFSEPPVAPDPRADNSSSPSESPLSDGAGSILSLFRKIFKTQLNKFSLFRVYNTNQLPSHDPDDPYSVDNINVPTPEHSDDTRDSNDTRNLYHPYPNKSAMLLGDWYWNEGTQKTQEGFKQLLGIVGNPSFSPSNVSQTPWNAIDKELGQNTFDSELPEWLDGDRGWNCSSVTISVPFHSRSNNPGPKDYTIHDFYHHSLVSIIRETVTNPAHAAFFHYEPYELRWQPPHRDHNVKVHGELFSSAAFLKAHDELQESPPEPGCDLPRIVAALMFWSDSAQLTTFGNAKLWPLYVYFGNQSKYKRCQPSCNLCCHMAYFHMVSTLVPSHEVPY